MSRIPYPPKNAKRCLRQIALIMVKGEAAILKEGLDGKLMELWRWRDFYRANR